MLTTPEAQTHAQHMPPLRRPTFCLKNYAPVFCQLKVIAPSDAVAAAIMDKRHGQHGYVSANGLTFHYVESGAGFKKGSAPLVLFLHGFPEVRFPS